MKIFKPYFFYSKNQRNGVLFLLIFIVVFQLLYFFVDLSVFKVSSSSEDKKALQEIDSIILSVKKDYEKKPYKINPNYLDDYKGYLLGLNTEEVDKVLLFINSNSKFTSKKHFKEVSGISDSLFFVISDKLYFPAKKKNKNYKKASSVNLRKVSKGDLNTVSARELEMINGIGEVLSKRIIKYRDLLGGFYFDDQLFEVYGLDKDVALSVLEKFHVVEKPIIAKVNINIASFKEILALPYIDYELTKALFAYRDSVGTIKNVNELINLDDFPKDKSDKIIVYLTAK